MTNTASTINIVWFLGIFFFQSYRIKLFKSVFFRLNNQDVTQIENDSLTPNKISYCYKLPHFWQKFKEIRKKLNKLIRWIILWLIMYLMSIFVSALTLANPKAVCLLCINQVCAFRGKRKCCQKVINTHTRWKLHL